MSHVEQSCLSPTLHLTLQLTLQVPGVGLEPSFLEEPVMLLAIVLLGRTLGGQGSPPCHR